MDRRPSLKSLCPPPSASSDMRQLVEQMKCRYFISVYAPENSAACSANTLNLERNSLIFVLFWTH